MNIMEKRYKDLSLKAKAGLTKFSKMSSEKMEKVADAYQSEKMLNPHNINNKESFYKFVASWSG